MIGKSLVMSNVATFFRLDMSAFADYNAASVGLDGQG